MHVSQVDNVLGSQALLHIGVLNCRTIVSPTSGVVYTNLFNVNENEGSDRLTKTDH